MKEVIGEKVSIEDVEIWFQDEARIGQRGTVTRIWARKGSRPRVIRQQQFEYAYLFGAFCPQKDLSAGLVLPQVGKICMQKHLEEIAKQIAPKKHGVIVFDKATWHTSKKLNIPKNISLLPLPVASPELNPAEQVWQVLRDRYLANRSFDSYDHIVTCCCEAWNLFTEQVNAVKNLCSREWAKI